jgi:hypothetical protein
MCSLLGHAREQLIRRAIEEIYLVISVVLEKGLER